MHTPLIRLHGITAEVSLYYFVLTLVVFVHPAWPLNYKLNTGAWFTQHAKLSCHVCLELPLFII